MRCEQPNLRSRAMPFSTGSRIDRYEILSLLGKGGMGEVYLARDTELGRTVALKLLPEELDPGEQRLRRFFQEARTASALNHPNILTIYEFGKFQSKHFIVTEYVEGNTLRGTIAGAPMEWRKVLDIAIQIAEALNAAHAAGIIHRDI